MPWIGTCVCDWSCPPVNNRNHVGKEMDNHAFTAYASEPWTPTFPHKRATVRHDDYTITPTNEAVSA